MHAMQYEITLPADYDMDVIRHRVASKGHLLDAFPGLGFKAYLMRERGRDGGSPVNQYAPFYLWNTAAGMHSFLWGPGFQGLSDDFGRPVVQHWPVLAYEEQAAPRGTARAAVRRRQRIPEAARLPQVAEELADGARKLAVEEGAVSALAAVDPHTWEAVHFSLWEHEAPEGLGDVFQVLHLSTPEGEQLRNGRQW
ncbi:MULTISPECIES: DUF4865 family protein [Streptomyces]|uniref:DUF4865 family protein n=1 Tax=Streptomyces TaxID=1883 RepID=UPI001E604C80|nr:MULTISPECIES: DUF4865 family protein [Streptomyces]UFQ14243.1 DUF4865 family protein [Streptomyces huasconensis]WCL83842.1 DUF4865 family protein [Streptomyces sp. JCM 35825]